MSYRQRLVPLLMASLLGVGTGVYIFDPVLKQYAIDSRGTFDPKVAEAGRAGGIGGGVVVSSDAPKVDEQKDVIAPVRADKAVISGPEARQHLAKLMQDSRMKKPLVSGAIAHDEKRKRQDV